MSLHFQILRWICILDDIIVYRRWPRSHSNYIRLWFDIVPSCKRAFSSNSIQACGSSWILPEWLTLYLLSRGESTTSKIWRTKWDFAIIPKLLNYYFLILNMQNTWEVGYITKNMSTAKSYINIGWTKLFDAQ